MVPENALPLAWQRAFFERSGRVLRARGAERREASCDQGADGRAQAGPVGPAQAAAGHLDGALRLVLVVEVDGGEPRPLRERGRTTGGGTGGVGTDDLPAAGPRFSGAVTCWAT